MADPAHTQQLEEEANGTRRQALGLEVRVQDHPAAQHHLRSGGTRQVRAAHHPAVAQLHDGRGSRAHAPGRRIARGLPRHGVGHLGLRDGLSRGQDRTPRGAGAGHPAVLADVCVQRPRRFRHGADHLPRHHGHRRRSRGLHRCCSGRRGFEAGAPRPQQRHLPVHDFAVRSRAGAAHRHAPARALRLARGLHDRGRARRDRRRADVDGGA